MDTSFFDNIPNPANGAEWIAESAGQPEQIDKIEIVLTDGKWLINEKPYSALSDTEKEFFDNFIVAVRLDNKISSRA